MFPEVLGSFNWRNRTLERDSEKPDLRYFCGRPASVDDLKRLFNLHFFFVFFFY